MQQGLVTPAKAIHRAVVGGTPLTDGAHPRRQLAAPAPAGVHRPLGASSVPGKHPRRTAGSAGRDLRPRSARHAHAGATPRTAQRYSLGGPSAVAEAAAYQGSAPALGPRSGKRHSSRREGGVPVVYPGQGSTTRRPNARVGAKSNAGGVLTGTEVVAYPEQRSAAPRVASRAGDYGPPGGVLAGTEGLALPPGALNTPGESRGEHGDARRVRSAANGAGAPCHGDGKGTSSTGSYVTANDMSTASGSSMRNGITVGAGAGTGTVASNSSTAGTGMGTPGRVQRASPRLNPRRRRASAPLHARHADGNTRDPPAACCTRPPGTPVVNPSAAAALSLPCSGSPPEGVQPVEAGAGTFAGLADLGAASFLGEKARLAHEATLRAPERDEASAESSVAAPTAGPHGTALGASAGGEFSGGAPQVGAEGMQGCRAAGDVTHPLHSAAIHSDVTVEGDRLCAPSAQGPGCSVCGAVACQGCEGGGGTDTGGAPVEKPSGGGQEEEEEEDVVFVEAPVALSGG